MNVENLNKLIEHLKAIPDEQFNMGEWCGSAYCIAGHACLLAGEPDNDIGFARVLQVAQGWLGLEAATADVLFSDGWPYNIEDVTRDGAISALKHLRDFGDLPEQLWERAT